MNNKISLLPKHWRDFIKSTYGPTGPIASLFNPIYKNNFTITFDDGSKASFKYCKAFISIKYDEILLLTEHCGYFIFDASCAKCYKPFPTEIEL